MDDDEGEGFEEWDADFLDQAIRVEENALCTPSPAAAAASNTLFLPPPSSTSTIPPSSYYLPPQPPPSQFTQSRLFVPPSHINAVASISHSPPRELSQRTVHRSKTSDQYFPPNGAQSTSASFNVGTAQSDGDKEHEIERLKRELRRVSKQLTSQELECTELRKERDKKEAQLKSIVSQTEGKGSGGCNLKGNDGGSREKEILKSDVNIQRNTAVESRSTCKGVGIQTDKSTDCTTSSLDDGQLARQNLARKLQSVWIPPFNYKVGSSLVSKLFVGCHALLRCVGADTSKTKSDSMDDGTSCDLDGLGPLQSSTAPDALKVLRLYSVTVKVSDGTAPLEGLLEPLVSLCGCDNVTVVHRSLCILHLVLKHLFITERNFEKRDNIIIKELLEDNVAGSEAQKLEFPHAIDFREAYYSSYEHESSGTRAQPGNQLVGSGVASTVSYIDCISLFELLHQIIMKNREQHLRLEAISIMNLILMQSSAYEEREKFGLPIVMESVSELLKKGCGSSIQIQAVHLLFLLLNCPKLLEAFSSLDSRNSSSVDDNATAINFQGSAIVLEGLAGCLACCGNDIKDLELRRKVIVLLAFLGSSGNAGFQIMMNHKLENGANFLMLILQALVLELDMEAAAEQCESPEVSKERTLLMREALILLNRLVSNPLYSSTSLRVLTKSRDMVSLSIDVANRMSRKPLKSLHINSSKLQGRDAEIVELASSFKRKVFAYLGDGIS